MGVVSGGGQEWEQELSLYTILIFWFLSHVDVLSIQNKEMETY